MNDTIKITAAGDILIMKRLIPGYEGISPIRKFLMQGEVRAANLETTISDGTCYASAYSGGTWLTAEEECLDDILQYGFNVLGVSNNHTMDYSYEGLQSTLFHLKKGKLHMREQGRICMRHPDRRLLIRLPDRWRLLISVRRLRMRRGQEARQNGSRGGRG